MQTLNQIADGLGVSHQTLRNRIEKYQATTSKDFYSAGQKDPLDSRKTIYPDDAVNELLQFIDPNYCPPPIEPEVAQMEIDDGNHRESRALTVQAESASLQQFRTDRIRQGLANPAEFMTGLTSMLDQIEDGMDKAEAQQEQELLQTRQTKRQAERRIEQFRRRADEYKIKSDILASIQNDELEQLEDLASEVNRLGKSKNG